MEDKTWKSGKKNDPHLKRANSYSAQPNIKFHLYIGLERLNNMQFEVRKEVKLSKPGTWTDYLLQREDIITVHPQFIKRHQDLRRRNWET